MTSDLDLLEALVSYFSMLAEYNLMQERIKKVQETILEKLKIQRCETVIINNTYKIDIDISGKITISLTNQSELL